MSVMHAVEQREGFPDPTFIFWCPGCKFGHGVWVNRASGQTHAQWTWNGSLEKPTFTPSLLITGTEFSAAGRADYEAWCAAGHPDRQGKPFDSVPSRCHSVVTDGKIHFCADCSHELAGQVVDMKDMDVLQVKSEAGRQ